MAAPTPGVTRKIYRGGAWDNNPEQRELPAAAAGIIPGNVLFRTATTFKKTDTSGVVGSQVFIANAPVHQDELTYSYASAETVFAYMARRKEVYACRVAASQTIAASGPVTVDAAGRVRLAVIGTDAVIGWAVSAIASPAVDTLVDIQFA